MPKCDVCGNDYDKSFQVILRDRTYTFDSLECAAHAIAPICAHCGCRILGHGIEAGASMYCCVHCASKMGVEGVADRVS